MVGSSSGATAEVGEAGVDLGARPHFVALAFHFLSIRPRWRGPGSERQQLDLARLEVHRPHHGLGGAGADGDDPVVRDQAAAPISEDARRARWPENGPRRRRRDAVAAVCNLLASTRSGSIFIVTTKVTMSRLASMFSWVARSRGPWDACWDDCQVVPE